MSRPESAGARFRQALKDNQPLQVVGTINAYTAIMAERIGHQAIYLSGAGVELMSASDNVVRGGMTDKPVDVDELLRILDPRPLAQPVMADAARSGRYRLPEAGCTLLRVEPGHSHTSTGHELAVSLAGDTLYLASGCAFTATSPTFVVTTA